MVRRFFVENALHWAHEYHVDALRLDATHAFVDESPRPFLAELAREVAARGPERKVLLIAANGGAERDNGTDRWLELRDVRLYEFAQDGRLKSLALVKIAEHRPGGWLLRDVTRTNFQAKSVTQEKIPLESWQSKLDAVALTAGTDKPRYLTARELRQAIDYRKRNSLEASEFEVIYWGRWFYALNILALCLAAVPFAFGTLRSGGLGKRLFIGIVFSLGFWLLQQQCVRLAQVYHFDYRLAYVMPTLVMLAVSWFLFRRRSG